jgi:fatty-acid desaturase
MLLANRLTLRLYWQSNQQGVQAVTTDNHIAADAEVLTARWIPENVGVSWANLVPIVILHALALLALNPKYFSHAGLGVFLVFAFIVAPIGINLCYHRMLTHRGLRVPKWLEYTFVLMAACCVEGPPAQWVATHRAHHRYADKFHDPHSPRQSFFWSHVGWLMFERSKLIPTSMYARDLLQDPLYRWLHGNLAWAWFFVVHALLLFAGGVGYGFWTSGSWQQGLALGWSILLWGVIVRSVAVWHITWAVNSLAHRYGYRNYETRDDSRNNILVALLTQGEWHNNHHGDPATCCNQHRWWELDVLWLFIKLLAAVGLATDVIEPRFRRKTGAGSALAGYAGD